MYINITDLTASAGAVSTALLGGIAWAVTEVRSIAKFVKEHEIVKKGKELVEAVFWIRDHLKSNQAAQQVLHTMEQAATTETNADPSLRDAILKDLIRNATDALKIEVSNVLADPIERQAVIQFVQSSPKVHEEAKSLVPTLLDALLQSIQEGRAEAKAHDVIRAAQTLKAPVGVQLVSAPAEAVAHQPMA